MLKLVVVVFDAELWIWDARRADSWTFVSMPTSASEEIRDLAEGSRRGFGSLRVRVTVGGSTWMTSIFPGSGGGSYVLPIKRAIRKAEAFEWVTSRRYRRDCRRTPGNKSASVT
jgi:hypothetical protein